MSTRFVREKRSKRWGLLQQRERSLLVCLMEQSVEKGVSSKWFLRSPRDRTQNTVSVHGHAKLEHSERSLCCADEAVSRLIGAVED